MIECMARRDEMECNQTRRIETQWHHRISSMLTSVGGLVPGSSPNVQAMAPPGRHCASRAGLMLKLNEIMEESVEPLRLSSRALLADSVWSLLTQ